MSEVLPNYDDLIKVLKCCDPYTFTYVCSECPYHPFCGEHHLLHEAIIMLEHQRGQIERLTPPVNIGDTVYAVITFGDDLNDWFVEPWKVRAVMLYDGEWYVGENNNDLHLFQSELAFYRKEDAELYLLTQKFEVEQIRREQLLRNGMEVKENES